MLSKDRQEEEAQRIKAARAAAQAQCMPWVRVRREVAALPIAEVPAVEQQHQGPAGNRPMAKQMAVLLLRGGELPACPGRPLTRKWNKS
jgi:hypothetical protein